MPSSIRYAGFYQPDLLRLLQQRKAALMPYHTETADGDPVNAQLVAEAFRGGVHNSLVDMGLSELNWATLRRRSSAVAVAASQGQRLSAAVPARIPVLARLSGLPTLPAVVVPAGSAWSSEGDGTNPPVVAEAAADITVDSVDLEVYWDAGAKTLHVGHRTLLFSGFAFSAAGYAVGLTFAPQFWTDAIRDSGAAGSWQSVSVGYQDGTEALTKAGTVQWSVPALFADAGSWWRRWAKTTVNGIEAYWVRLVGSGAGSGVTTPAGTPAQPWYVWFQALQGETVTDLLGTTDGSAWQKHRLKQSPLIEESILQVAFGDDLSWAEIDNPSLAGPAARVWWLVEDAQGYAIQTGDGVNGVVPPSGVAVEAEYRIGADVDGNVGVGTLVVNRSGTPRIAAVTNPAAGSGWEAAEGSTAASLARASVMRPALLRTNERAVTLEDHEVLAVSKFTTADGRSPFARAHAVQEGAGPRSVKLWLVGPESAVPAPGDLDEASLYFNGQRIGTQREGGVGFYNTTTVPAAFVRRELVITTTIEVLRDYAAGAKAAAEAALLAAIQPLSEAFGEWRWWPGQTYSSVGMKGILTTAVTGFFDFQSFVVNGVESPSLVLAAGELPTAVSVTVTVVRR